MKARSRSKGFRNYRAFTDRDRAFIMAGRKSGVSYKMIGHSFGVSGHTIERVVKGTQRVRTGRKKPPGVMAKPRPHLTARGCRRTISLLRVLGVPRSAYEKPPDGRVGFWTYHNVMVAESLWETVKDSYKKMMTKCHPDKGGDGIEARAVTRAFSLLKKQFAKRIH